MYVIAHYIDFQFSYIETALTAYKSASYIKVSWKNGAMEFGWLEQRGFEGKKVKTLIVKKNPVSYVTILILFKN